MLPENKKKNNESAIGKYKRILVAVDGSDNARRAAAAAMTICEKFGAELSILQVVIRPTSARGMNVRLGPMMQDYHANIVKQAEKEIRQLYTLAKSRHLRVTAEVLDYTHSYSVVEGILDYAAGKGVDLIVVGTRGLGGFKKLIMGSVSSGIINHAYCSVLVVR